MNTPTKFEYLGRPLESYSKEELIKIAEEGWTLWFALLDNSRKALELQRQLHGATKGLPQLPRD